MTLPFPAALPRNSQRVVGPDSVFFRLKDGGHRAIMLGDDVKLGAKARDVGTEYPAAKIRIVLVSNRGIIEPAILCTEITPRSAGVHLQKMLQRLLGILQRFDSQRCHDDTTEFELRQHGDVLLISAQLDRPVHKQGLV